jgi:hypothetical protein
VSQDARDSRPFGPWTPRDPAHRPSALATAWEGNRCALVFLVLGMKFRACHIPVAPSYHRVSSPALLKFYSGTSLKEIAQELTILLPQPPECWDYRRAPPRLANMEFCYLFCSLEVWIPGHESWDRPQACSAVP